MIVQKYLSPSQFVDVTNWSNSQVFVVVCLVCPVAQFLFFTINMTASIKLS